MVPHQANFWPDEQHANLKTADMTVLTSRGNVSKKAAANSGNLEKPVQGYEPFTPSDPAALRKSLEPGDVFLSYSASERWAGFGAGRLETVWLRISRRTRRDRCGRNQDLPHICDALEPAS